MLLLLVAASLGVYKPWGLTDAEQCFCRSEPDHLVL